MALPIIHLREGSDATYATGSGYSDLPTLFRDLHEGVLELGVGVAEVRYLEQMELRKMGFWLGKTDRVHWRAWEFVIQIDAMKASLSQVPTNTRKAWVSMNGRMQLAALFEQGLSPEAIDQALT